MAPASSELSRRIKIEAEPSPRRPNTAREGAVVPWPVELWKSGGHWQDLREILHRPTGVTIVTWNGSVRWLHSGERWQLRLPAWQTMRSDGVRHSLHGIALASPCGVVTLTTPTEFGVAKVHATTPVLWVLDGLVDPHEIHREIDDLTSQREEFVAATHGHPPEACGAPYCQMGDEEWR